MNQINKALTNPISRPVKVLQFGEGNFLRGFVDYMIDIANEKGLFQGNIVIVKPIEHGTLTAFKNQDCQYTVSLRGLVEGNPGVINRQITSVEAVIDCYEEYSCFCQLAFLEDLRFIISNTTEAGIVYDPCDSREYMPPRTFPGKLTEFLYRRYLHFQGDFSKGLIMLPVELIDDNGIVLKQCVLDYIKLWNLESEFQLWVEKACIFTSTLVDRIITGYPKNEEEEWEKLGYRDSLLVTGEPFALWVIESNEDISQEFPLHKAGLPILFTTNQKPYKQRKVRILNGAHTSFVMASYLCGNNIVRASMEDETIFQFMKNTIFREIIPTLSLPKEELEQFAHEVILRFKNPYVDHSLLAISLNSVSKWRARCLPSLLDYWNKYNVLPSHLTFSLAALAAFYHGKEIRDNALIAYRDKEEYTVIDDSQVLHFFQKHYDSPVPVFLEDLLSQTSFWGRNLNEIPGFLEAVTGNYLDIQELGMRNALCKLINE